MEQEPVISKKRFAASVRIWINHKKVIAENSMSDHYKRADVQNSFRKINDLLRMVKRDCAEYNMNDLYRILILNEQNLRNILPVQKNSSYTTSLEKLENLLLIAKTHKK